MSDCLVIIPTYNEKDNIEAIVRYVFQLPTAFDVLVVDDSSPDGTGAIVAALQSEFPERLNLEVRKGKLGLGTAYIHGFKWAIAHQYNYVVEMDADFSHNPDDLAKLYDACKIAGNDVAIGSRYAQGVNVVNWPMSRVLMSYFASVYVRMITRMPIMDTTAGFVCYKVEVLKRMNLDKIKFIGYAFQIEMKFVAWKLGYKIKEISIVFTDRKKGVSKMSTGIFKEAIFGVIYIKLKSWFNFPHK